MCRALLKEFMFAPNYVCLNQGSYGSVPRVVYDYAEKVIKWPRACVLCL